MNRLSALGRALAVLIAIASAFFSSPLTVPLLLIFGGLAAIGNTPERNSKNYLMAIVLISAPKRSRACPMSGPIWQRSLGPWGSHLSVLP